MKKSLFIIASLVLAVSACTTFKDEATIAPVIPSDPIVMVSEVGDTEFNFSIQPAAGTGFYSYAIIAGEKQELNPTTLLKVGYKAAVKAGTVDYKETQKLDGKASGLAYATTYTVYAVAASEQGNLGSVVSTTVTTSDSSKPEISGYTRKENVLTLSFSEPVTVSTVRKATASYYAINAVVIVDGEISKDGKQGDGAVDIVCTGKTATLTVTQEDGSPLPAGAYYTVSFSTGLFQDASGNSLPGVTSEIGVTSSGSVGFSGLYGRKPAGTFDLVPPTDIVTPNDPNIVVDLEEGVQYAGMSSAAAASLAVEVVEGAKTTVVSYDLAAKQDWGYSKNDGAIIVNFPTGMEANSGDHIVVKISGGSIIDIYGNTSNAMEQRYLYSYGYTLADLCGTWTLTATTEYAGTYKNQNVIIAPAPTSDEDYTGLDVAIYNLFEGTPCCNDLDSFEYMNAAFGATFDGDTGMLDLAWYDAIGVGALARYDWNNYVFALCLDTEDNTFGFSMPEKGKLVLNDVISVYLNKLGTWDVYQAATLVKTSDDYSVPNAAPAKKAAMPRNAKFTKKNVK